MQHLSLTPVLANAFVFPTNTRFQEFFQREDVRHLASFLPILIVSSQIVHIVSLWITSKILVEREGASVKNALKVWGLNLLLQAAVIALLVVLIVEVGLAEDRVRLAIVIGGAVLFNLLMVFLIPMKVYSIGFWHALGVLVLTAIFSGMLASGVNAVLFAAFGLNAKIAALTATFGKTQRDQQAFLIRLFGSQAPDEIDRLLDDALEPIGPKPSLREREARVALLQQKLKARQNSFPRGTPLPPAFQEQLNRYLHFLNEVKAERAASPGAP